tara:strand:+ start:387 stop:497 length:111 start_codon:yes stop_codon:yes gene_type:complete
MPINDIDFFILKNIGGAIGLKLEPTSPLLQKIRLCP